MARVHQAIAAKQKKFRVLDEVEQWKKQFIKDDSGMIVDVPSRFKMLVLLGPSRTGKTQFAKSIFGPDSTLVVECQRASEPCLHNYEWGKHAAIVFDEAQGSMVVGNKQLFQSPADEVRLGQSQCNQNSYLVLVYGVGMIICRTMLRYVF